jgi:peptidoglycan/LPS O-acetylase OafA/YrhL
MQKHVYGLDLVRAVAISAVVFQHGALFFNLCYGTPEIWVKAGSFGVTMFFALSGFLIGGLLLDQGESLGGFPVAARFWLRRALRTLPNYWLFIGVNLAFWFLRQRAIGYPNPFPLVPRYLLFLQNFSSTPTWFFSESWSLSVEEWFYLVFPLGLYLGLRLARIPFGRLYGALACLMVVLPVALRGLVLTQEEWARGITKVVIYRPDAIALGLLTVALCRRFPGSVARLRLPAAIGGTVVLAEAILYMGRGDPNHSAAARTFLPLLVAVGCSLLLPWASTCTDLGGRFVNTPVRAIARWSYSMYLVNLIISGTVLSHMQFHYGTAIGVGSYVAACVLASAAVYRWFEAPILRWRDRRISLGRSAAC